MVKIKKSKKEEIIEALENNLFVNIVWIRDVFPDYKKCLLEDYKKRGIKFKNSYEYSDGILEFECEKDFKFKNLGECKKNILDKLDEIDSEIEVFTAFDEKGNILFTEEIL